MHNFQTNTGYSIRAQNIAFLTKKHAKNITFSNFYADDLLA